MLQLENLQLIYDDVWSPELLHRKRNPGDTVTLIRVPNQELMVPILQWINQKYVKISAFIITLADDKSDCNTFIYSVLSFHATYQPQPQESSEYLGFLILKNKTINNSLISSEADFCL